MIVSDLVRLKVNLKNIDSLREKGYQNLELSQIIDVKVEDLSKGSHTIIKVKCDVCGKVRDEIMYKEYLRNIKKGGYYSCKGKCSTDKIKETNIERYGVEFYSKTNESKNKVKETNLVKYGFDSYTKTEECQERMKKTMMEKYGVENASNSDFFKQKRKDTMNEKYGVDYYVLHEEFLDKSKETCIKNYGVDHPMKVEEEVKKRLNKKGLDFETDEFKKYRSKVDRLTRINKNELLENWNGFDYYDGEYILDNFNLVGQHGDYPTIDHKISVYYGFNNNIDPEEISCIDNLCFTKRRINSKKYNKIDFTL